MKHSINIPYGDSEKRLEVDDKNLLFSVEPPIPPRPSLREEQDEVRRAISNPIGTPNLDTLIQPQHKVAILVDDFTRPTPAYKVMLVVLETLAKVGVADDNVNIIIARGTHRRLSRADMEQKVGKEVVERFEVKNHENDRNLVSMGKSKMGTPVWINQTVVEADIRIAIGSVCAHPVAGYGGGAKIIVPGVAGVETIHVNHSRCDHPNVTIGVTDGNPVREDMNDIAQIAKLDFIINTILNPQKEIIRVVAGDVIMAHKEGVKFYSEIYGTKADEPADIVVIGASPRDATFGHATFALYAGVSMAKAGGTLILVAPCTEGPGSKAGRESFRELATMAPDELMTLIRKGEVSASGGAFDYCYSKAMNRNRVVLVSDNYSASEARDLGVGYANSVQEAVDNALADVGTDARVGVLPVGGLTVPFGLSIVDC
ncbi:nickel-dependent lactate racemase [Candidatus Poribacteria bacterium]|nr:nickel-dependent lactate racemase [Candidatus Poribacteria bacterium]